MHIIFFQDLKKTYFNAKKENKKKKEKKKELKLFKKKSLYYK